VSSYGIFALFSKMEENQADMKAHDFI